MSSITTTAITVDPLLRPRTVLDPFDAAQREKGQRAAGEGRLEPVSIYDLGGPSDNGSYMNVLSGVLGFITFMIAVPVTLTTYLSRHPTIIDHQNVAQFDGGGLVELVVANLIFGYLFSVTHQGLHVAAASFMGGKASITQTEPFRFTWSAPGQAFSRRAFAVVLLAPLVTFTVIWLVGLLVAPLAAGYFIVALVVNVVASGRDLWLVGVLRQQPANTELFVTQDAGFVGYAITATKPARKKTVTTPLSSVKSKPVIRNK